MVDIDQIRHPKENTYYTIMVVVSIIIYISLSIPIVIGFIIAIPLILVLAFFSWWFSLLFKAEIYGSAIHVNAQQYPEIYNAGFKFSQELGLELPPIFIRNSEGMVNAMAAKVFLSKYIILDSSLVDLMLSTGRNKELEMILGHELGHHAAGHLSFKKKFLTTPAKFIPFLGSAYSRGCELTCDRVGYKLSQDLNSAQNALVALALGSKILIKQSNIQAFSSQETEIPQFAAFINKLTASHPRTTVRVEELSYFSNFSNQSTISYNNEIYKQPNVYKNNPNSHDVGKKYCSDCGAENNNIDSYCANCGNKLN